MNALARAALPLLCPLLLASLPAAQDALKLADLVNHPERWPATVKLAKDFQFGSGKAVKAGQPVKVLEFNGAQVVVDAGGELYFEVAPADCDLLSAANEAWAALTPAQREVDGQKLLQDASLWPEHITCSSGFNLADGGQIAPGGEFEFLSLDREGVKFYSREHQTTLVADLPQTDLVARARQRALLEPEKRASRVAAALKKGLVDAQGKPWTGANVEGASVYALYFGASWCPPCRKFSPDLVKYVNEVGRENPRLATVLLSNDKERADMLEYMSDEKMPWPALPLETLQATPLLLSLAGGSIPHLVILDRHGLVLASSVENGRYVGVVRPFETLKKLVASGAAK